MYQLHKVYNELSQALLRYQTDKNAINFKEAGLELWSAALFNNMEVLLGGYITGDKNEQ